MRAFVLEGDMLTTMLTLLHIAAAIRCHNQFSFSAAFGIISDKTLLETSLRRP
jgi:hypothetical protein